MLLKMLRRLRSNFSVSHHWRQPIIWQSIISKQTWATCLICRGAPQWASYPQPHHSHQPASWHLKLPKICHYNNPIWIMKINLNNNRSKSMIQMENFLPWIVKVPSCSSPRSGLSGRQSIPSFLASKKYRLCKEESCRNGKRRSRIIKPLKNSETLPEMR